MPLGEPMETFHAREFFQLEMDWLNFEFSVFTNIKMLGLEVQVMEVNLQTGPLWTLIELL